MYSQASVILFTGGSLSGGREVIVWGGLCPGGRLLYGGGSLCLGALCPRGGLCPGRGGGFGNERAVRILL